MSDPIVIAAFEDRIQTNLPLGVEYVRTLNVRPPKLPDLFVSLERDYSAVDRITLSMPLTQFRELGSLTVAVNVRSGQGVSEAEITAEQIRNLFHNFNVDHLHIQTVGSAAVIAPDDGNFFQVRFPVVYQFDFFK